MELKLGVAGLGHGATLLQANTPAGRHLPLQVTAVCDSDGARAQAAAERYQVPVVTTDFAELVARPELDVIGIYTPGPLHAAQILAALDAGKHVMVTKSMVYTMEEVERVVAAVDRSRRVLLVSQSLRARLDFLEAKRACDAGEIGEPYLAEAHYIHDLRPVYDYSPWRVEMPQDLILGGACHPIDLLRWFMGDIEEVHCYGQRSGLAPDYPQEDNFVINVRFASGRIGRIAAFLGVVEPPEAPDERAHRVRHPRRRSQRPQAGGGRRLPAGALLRGDVFQHLAAGAPPGDAGDDGALGGLHSARTDPVGRGAPGGAGGGHRAGLLGVAAQRAPGTGPQ